MVDEKVEWNYDTGRPIEVVSTVLRRISAYTRVDRVKYFKIGITNNPARRFNEAYKTNYDKMIVIYESQSINNVRELECLLVEHNRELADNINAGGGGNPGKPPQYLYVVIKNL